MLFVPFNIWRQIFFSGTSDFWYQPTSHVGDPIKEEYVDALVRVKMWLPEDMPPDYDSGFIHNLKSKDDSNNIAGERERERERERV